MLSGALGVGLVLHAASQFAGIWRHRSAGDRLRPCPAVPDAAAVRPVRPGGGDAAADADCPHESIRPGHAGVLALAWVVPSYNLRVPRYWLEARLAEALPEDSRSDGALHRQLDRQKEDELRAIGLWLRATRRRIPSSPPRRGRSPLVATVRGGLPRRPAVLLLHGSRADRRLGRPGRPAATLAEPTPRRPGRPVRSSAVCPCRRCAVRGAPRGHGSVPPPAPVGDSLAGRAAAGILDAPVRPVQCTFRFGYSFRLATADNGPWIVMDDDRMRPAAKGVAMCPFLDNDDPRCSDHLTLCKSHAGAASTAPASTVSCPMYRQIVRAWPNHTVNPVPAVRPAAG